MAKREKTPRQDRRLGQGRCARRILSLMRQGAELSSLTHGRLAVWWNGRVVANPNWKTVDFLVEKGLIHSFATPTDEQYPSGMIRWNFIYHLGGGRAAEETTCQICGLMVCPLCHECRRPEDGRFYDEED